MSFESRKCQYTLTQGSETSTHFQNKKLFDGSAICACGYMKFVKNSQQMTVTY